MGNKLNEQTRFGKVVKEELKKLGIKKIYFCSSIGITPSSLQNIAVGNAPLTGAMEGRVREFFLSYGVSLPDFRSDCYTVDGKILLSYFTTEDKVKLLSLAKELFEKY